MNRPAQATHAKPDRQAGKRRARILAPDAGGAPEVDDSAHAAQLAGVASALNVSRPPRVERPGKKFRGKSRRDGRPRLAEACEPLFLHACRLNRSVALGTEHDPRQIHADFVNLLEGCAATAAAQGRAESFARVRPVLVAYADHVAGNLDAAWAKAYEPIGEGDADVLAEAIDDLTSRDAEVDADVRQEAVVVYLCMATGFPGKHGGETQGFLRELDRVARLAGVNAASGSAKKLGGGAATVGAAAGGFGDAFAAASESGRDDASDRLCAAAYAHTDARDLSTGIGGRIWTVALAAALLVLATLVAGGVVYHSQAQRLDEQLRQFRGATPSTQPATREAR